MEPLPHTVPGPGPGPDSAVVRRRVLLRGVVQGVGMRPHIAKVAAKYPLSGWCSNNDVEVTVELQGGAASIQKCIAEIVRTLPPLAFISDVKETSIAPAAEELGFRILASTHSQGARTLIPPDVAPCEDCMREFHSPSDRRYHYPFITCTNCGPRASIIRDLPYDRPNTTMRVFPMCPQCEAEYTDPNDRRFHAQPISCPDCGPTMWLERADAPNSAAPRAARGNPQEVIAEAQKLLAEGKILAVRGIGGFHLMASATHPEAVARLRQRKARPHKPFAVMVPDEATAQEIARFDQHELALLRSPARPIVIVPQRPIEESEVKLRIAEEVAPGLEQLGLVLPYSPLHTLLVDTPVVATSGNPSGEPLITDNAQAREVLGRFCDAFLFHDREIHVPIEDSVYLSTTPVRRSRGMAPLPLKLPATLSARRAELPSVFAAGGELKNTVCLTALGQAHVSAHVGDAASLRAQQLLSRTFEQLCTMRAQVPEAIVCDLHPGYATTSWAQRLAEELDVPLLQVQHHEAHAASILAEHNVSQPAVVIAADGTGYGTDATIWGGEIFATDGQFNMVRRWHVPHFPIVGGDAAVRYPWRLAIGAAAAWGLGRPRIAELVDATELALVDSQVHGGRFSVATSSLGRLFDAAGALLGCGDFGRAVSYEAQVAMECEQLARKGSCRWDAVSTVEEAFAQLMAASDQAARDVGAHADAARQFHRHLAQILGVKAAAVAADIATDVVAITGGCALNQLLVADLEEFLGRLGLTLLRHRLLPPNDGGLSYGQAVLATARLR
ncbi:carbamoyltransferase HypF [Corynebacterium sp. 35RC1]|nr:carbamoyltransferase HypF [Corynebacterium sp. 35RC1]